MRTGFRPASEQERKALGVPPAYTDVCVPVEPGGKLLAVARIPNGKTYYKYAKAETERNAHAKWKRVAKLGEKLEKVEARIERDVQKGDGVAVCARLIMLTGMRNGNPPQGGTPSFGASSLQIGHVVEREIDGTYVKFEFPGKHNVLQTYEIRDAAVAEFVAKRIGETSNDKQASIFVHSAHDTLRYLKKVGAAKVHDLRTLRANVAAEMLVGQILEGGKPATKKELKIAVKLIAEAVGKLLCNKPSQALKSYIDPSILKRLED
jgi:DNA topoisomerase-1